MKKKRTQNKKKHKNDEQDTGNKKPEKKKIYKSTKKGKKVEKSPTESTIKTVSPRGKQSALWFLKGNSNIKLCS